MNDLGSPHGVEGTGPKRDRLSGTADDPGIRDVRGKGRSHSRRRLASDDLRTAEPGEGIAEAAGTGTKIQDPSAGRRQVGACGSHPSPVVSRTKAARAVVAGCHRCSV